MKEFKHGRWGYETYKCRCSICKKAMRDKAQKSNSSEGHRKSTMQYYKTKKGEDTTLRGVSKLLVKKYGIDIIQYEKILVEQHGHCACCNVTPGAENKNRRLAVDHNHATGKVRGLLCYWCNIGLGMAKESRHTLENMVEYLNKYSE